jgi:plasmid stabilization system protein ParE
MRAIHKQTAAEDDLVDIWQYSIETWGADQADLYLDARSGIKTPQYEVDLIRDRRKRLKEQL